MRKKIVGHAILNACLTAVYIALAASFLFYAPAYFSGSPNTGFASVLTLSVFIFSAVVMALLVVGRPILWYLDNRKSEALLLLGYTLALFFAIMLIAFVLLNRFSISSNGQASSWTSMRFLQCANYGDSLAEEYNREQEASDPASLAYDIAQTAAFR